MKEEINNEKDYFFIFPDFSFFPFREVLGLS